MGEKGTEVMECLREFKEVAKKYKVERIILFGSQVTGKIKESSDVDLIVLSKEKDKLGLLQSLYHEWHINQKIDLPVDFICYTREEFEKKKKEISIVRVALKEGIEIW